MCPLSPPHSITSRSGDPPSQDDSVPLSSQPSIPQEVIEIVSDDEIDADPFLAFENELAAELEDDMMGQIDLPLPAYHLHQITPMVEEILNESLSFFVSGAPAYVVPVFHPLANYPLTHCQIIAIASLELTVPTRGAAIEFILYNLSFSTLVLLQLVLDDQVVLDAEERSRLVLTLLVGFLAFHWEDDIVFDLIHFTSSANVRAARYIHRHPEERGLRADLVSLETAIGSTFNFSLLSPFYRMPLPN